MSLCYPMVVPRSAVDSFWTVFTATEPSGEGSGHVGAGTRKIYVSAQSGNDSNTGTLASPKATILAGLALLRNGSPDWCLLKKGDVWTQEQMNFTNKAGLSAAEPMLIGAYGTGARPLIKRVSTIDPFESSHRFEGNCSNMYIVGLNFYAHTRDPDGADYIPANADGEESLAIGISLEGSGSTFTMEDCKISFYRHNFDCIGPYTTVKLRRCVILSAYDHRQPTTGNTEGVFFSYCQNAYLEECIFDSNGWVGTHTPIQLSHAGYFRQAGATSPANGTTGAGTITGCWISRNAADGGQLRRGGTFTKNFSTLQSTGWEIGHNIDDAEGCTETTVGTCEDNVSMRQQSAGAGRAGHGFVMLDTRSGVSAHNNIVAHIHPNAEHTGGGGGAIFAQPIYLRNCTNTVVTNNIIFDWPTDDNLGVYVDGGSGNTSTPNEIDLPGANTFGYSNPNLTVGDYYASIGGTNDEVAFCNAMRAQSKDTWDSRLTAKAVINYIRAGFDMDPIT